MIPKILHAFWGGPPMPEHLAGYLEKWRELHPHWEFRLWTPETIPQLRNQDLYNDPGRFSPSSNPWQWRSDLTRYEILHDRGGVYVDCDLEPLKPIDELVEGCEAVIAREDKTMINNAFMGSAPGSAFLSDILDGLRGSVLSRPQERVNRQIGAFYLTAVARRHPRLRILPSELIYPLHWSEVRRRRTTPRNSEQAYTIHHWHNQATLMKKGRRR